MKTHAPGIAMTVFAALILIMELALLGYWYWLLEPRLRTEAASQAQVLAQAQAATLATALASDDPLQRSLQLDEAIDSLLLLRAPGRDDSFFDSLRRYRKSQGRLLLYLIMTYLSDGRMIRITGDVGPQYLPLTKQPGWATYDIIVDDAPSSPQQKELTWGLLAQMMPMIKDSLTPDMWGLILDQSPFPSSFTEKFKQLIQQGQQQNAQNAAEQQQVQKAGAIAKVNKDQTAAELNRSKAAMHLKQAEKHHVDLSMPSIAPVPPNAGPMEAA